MQLLIPIGSIFVDDFLQNGLQCLVGGFSQSISPRVVWCALLLYYDIMVRKPLSDLVHEMPFLVVDKFNQTSESAPNVFI